jgi:hypothetical protein
VAYFQAVTIAGPKVNAIYNLCLQTVPGVRRYAAALAKNLNLLRPDRDSDRSAQRKGFTRLDLEVLVSIL